MTDTADKAELYTDEIEGLEDDDLDDSGLTQVTESVELSGRCEISVNIGLRDVHSLEQALDTLAATLGRYGLEPFYVLATDPETGQRWVVNGGRVFLETDDEDETDGDSDQG